MYNAYRSMVIGGQFARANARRGALRLFLALLRREEQNGFLKMFGILGLVRLVAKTAVAAINAPPTTAPQVSAMDSFRDELRFFLDVGGISVL